MACAAGIAILTALGRAAPFGAEHGFATRYVSYSILFWFGWFMLVLGALAERPNWRKWLLPVLLLTAVFGSFNALHLTNKAINTSRNADDYAQLIVEQYPNYDRAMLEQAYGDAADVAKERLETWRQYGFAPFDQPPATARDSR